MRFLKARGNGGGATRESSTETSRLFSNHQYSLAGPVEWFVSASPAHRQGPLIDRGLNWCCVIYFLAPGVLMERVAVTLVYANGPFAIPAK